MLFLQTHQKQERQATPKKTPEKRDEDDEYAGSTDVDEPGLHKLILKLWCPTVKKKRLNFTWCLDKIQSTSAIKLQ